MLSVDVLIDRFGVHAHSRTEESASPEGQRHSDRAAPAEQHEQKNDGNDEYDRTYADVHDDPSRRGAARLTDG
jgi:hypothetical protein